MTTYGKSTAHFRAMAHQMKLVGTDLASMQDDPAALARCNAALLCLENACLAILPGIETGDRNVLRFALETRSMRILMRLPLETQIVHRAKVEETVDLLSWITPEEFKQVLARGLGFTASIHPLLIKASECPEFRAVFLEDAMRLDVPQSLHTATAWQYDRPYRIGDPDVTAQALEVQVKHFPELMGHTLTQCLAHTATPVPAVALALAGAPFTPNSDGIKSPRHADVVSEMNALVASLSSSHGRLAIHEKYGSLASYLGRMTRIREAQPTLHDWRLPPVHASAT